MKTAVVYYSHHHGNTKKLLDALPEDVTLREAEGKDTDLSAYGRIGFASGIYGGSFAPQVLEFAKKYLPEGKDVFFAATAAMKLKGHFKAIRRVCEGKNCRVLGEYLCQGYNTFGPFKLVGGTSKGHPTKEETDAFRAFYDALG